MNPLTLGIYAFHEQLRLLLSEPPPGRPPTAMARLVVDGVDDTQLLQTIRLYENADTNLHSFTLHTDAIANERAFLAGARRQLQGDADAVRACFKRAGEEIAKYDVPELQTLDAFANAAASIASASTDYLDGLVVGLLPAELGDAALWQRLVQSLAGVAKHPRLVVLVKDDGSDWMKRAILHEVTLRVDQKALWKHLRDPKGPNQAGPRRDDVPKLTPAARLELEKTNGQRILTEESGEVLRHLIMDAGQAFAEGQLEVAAKRFRLARTYCQMLGLQAERATCAIAVGTARFALGQRELALKAYEEGRAIAEEHGLGRIEMQALLGIASTHATMGAFSKARDAYARCRAAAVELPGMQVECLRSIGQTFALEKRPGDAVSTWLDALAEVEALAPLERAQTPYKAIVDHLAEELPRAARAHEVSGVRGRGQAIEASIQSAAGDARDQELLS